MQFSIKSDIDMLKSTAFRLGATLKEGRFDLIVELLQHHEYYMVASAEGRMKAEAVTVSEEGDFICVMIDTNNVQPVSLVYNNFHNFDQRSSTLAAICDTLEHVRQSFFLHQENGEMEEAA